MYTLFFRRLLSYFFTVFILLPCLSACGGSNESDQQLSSPPSPAPITQGNWFKPQIGSSWHWQLMGKIDTQYDVDIYDIDLFDTSASIIKDLQIQGKRVICYFSAGSYEQWRIDNALFLKTDLGNPLANWEGERWLDIRSSNVQNIMISRLDLALEKGCDGVEADNVDGYMNNSGFDLSAKNQLNFNRLLANEAHKRGLSIGLKNDLSQVKQLVDYFDFAVNEQCYEFAECNLLQPFINNNKPVFHAEYNTKYITNPEEKEKMCEDANEKQFSTLILSIDLDGSYTDTCL